MSIGKQINNIPKQKGKRRTTQLSRRNTQTSQGLPKNYRLLVVEKLKAQGIEISVQTVTNLRNGHVKNLELVKKVTTAVQEIKDSYIATEVERKALIGK